MLEKFQDLISFTAQALGKLGARRLIALGLIGVVLFTTVLVSSFYLTRPSYETLYIGLSRDDVNRMGMALGEAGIVFDVSSDGASVRVPVGMAEKARMFLAEKGLPTSNNAGYELFDKMGSLGLTSFMQEITRQRALEGEIARTIQAVQGVRAARVHIVLPDKGSFRRVGQKPTASVVIRTDGGFAAESAASIRQLVAAAIPSLEAGSVTVTDTSGRLLASGADTLNGSPVMMVSLEQQIATQIDENIRKQLTPYLGLSHFQTSVQVDLDTDRHQIKETVYDPDSQVARSVRAVRDQGDSRNSRNNDAVSVEQNIPQEEVNSGNGENSSDKRERREDITNYEINSKTTSTVSDGYQVKKLAVAVVVDRSRLATQGNSPVSANYIDDQIARIRQMVSAAAGLDTRRGDVINVTAVDFISPEDNNMQPVSQTWSVISRYVPTLINSGVMLAAVLLVLFLGVRPLVREVRNSQRSLEEGLDPALAADGGETPLLPQSAGQQDGDGVNGSGRSSLNDLRQRLRVPPQTRLEQMVEMDEERFVGVLRDWIHQEPSANQSAG